MTDLPFEPNAREEFLEQVARYGALSAILGAEFVSEVERAVHRVVSFPESGSPYLSGTRRMVLRRFPFSLVYTSRSRTVTVVAVAHHHRRPGYWRGRL